MSNDFPRRNQFDLMTDEEALIFECISKVEELGADLRLTRCVELLGQAQNALADYVDNVDNVADHADHADSVIPGPQNVALTPIRELYVYSDKTFHIMDDVIMPLGCSYCADTNTLKISYLGAGRQNIQGPWNYQIIVFKKGDLIDCSDLFYFGSYVDSSGEMRFVFYKCLRHESV